MARLKEIENCVAVFIMATYGEGDPTDNAQEMHGHLETGEVDLTGLKYAVCAFLFATCFPFFRLFMRSLFTGVRVGKQNV